MNFSNFLFVHICKAFFEKEQSVQSNSNPTTLGRIPTAHQNHSLNIFNKVDSSNENVAQNSPNSNFPIEHLESNCSRVEIVRGDSSDSSPAIERVEQDQSSFQQENQSVSHNMNSTTIDIQNITVDDFAVEDDSNISDMDLEDALSTQMSSSRATSIFDDVPLLNHDWEIASVVSNIISMLWFPLVRCKTHPLKNFLSHCSLLSLQTIRIKYLPEKT